MWRPRCDVGATWCVPSAFEPKSCEKCSPWSVCIPSSHKHPIVGKSFPVVKTCKKMWNFFFFMLAGFFEFFSLVFCIAPIKYSCIALNKKEPRVINILSIFQGFSHSCILSKLSKVYHCAKILGKHTKYWSLSIPFYYKQYRNTGRLQRRKPD